MASIFYKPILAPLRSFWQSDKLPSDSGTVNYKAFNPSFNYARQFDEDFAARSKRFFEEDYIYIRPCQQSDIIRDFFYGSDTTAAHYTARLLNSKGAVVVGKTITVTQQSGTYNGYKAYTVEFVTWDLPEGVYFLQYKHNNGTENSYMICEPFNLKQIHENTVRIDYKNSYNDQDIVWFAASFEFQIRLKATITKVTPNAKFTTYDDQPNNSAMVSGIPQRDYEILFISIPEWENDKLDRIFISDSTKINGKAFTRESGSKLEPKSGSELNPLKDYLLKLREADNTVSVSHNMQIKRLCDMPQTQYFWVERMMIEGTYITIRQGFKGKRNFLDYLNTNQKVGDGYWSEDAGGKLAFYADDEYTFTGSWVIDAVDLLGYGLKFSLRPNTTDFDIDISATAGKFYAVSWSDGTASTNKTSIATYPATTNIARTVSGSIPVDMFIYATDMKTIVDAATNIDVFSIGGDLAPGMTYFNPFQNNPQVELIENDMFRFVTALDRFDLYGMNLDTYAINDVLRWLYDHVNSLATSAYIILQAQTLVAPPSQSLSPITAAIRKRLLTGSITTD